MVAIVWVLAGCGEADVCDEGQVRRDGACTDYVPSDPVPYEGPLRLDPGVPWQWQITGKVDTSHDVPVYDVDVFDLTEDVYAQLRADDRIVICYFSAGSYEEWRDDAGAYPEEAIGKKLDDWPDERWVDVMNPDVRDILRTRLDFAAEWGCDGVEPDNVTAHHNNTGFGINETEQLDFNRFLADEAHARGMMAGLKNDTDQIDDLVDWFDFAVNEECAAYDECDTNQPFLDAGKAVLHAEYVDDWADAADRAREVCGVLDGLSTIVKDWDLGPKRQDCTGL